MIKKTNTEKRRRQMVAGVRRGTPLREVAREFQVAPSTVLFWTRRAGTARLARVAWTDRPRGPRTPGNRVPRALEDVVLRLRVELQQASDLGEFGAPAIQAALRERGGPAVPSVRTLGRILARRGALDGRHRRRHPAPPPGWDPCLTSQPRRPSWTPSTPSRGS